MASDLFGIYLHWPFCARLCPYCDFNVYAAKARDPEPLVRALEADLQLQAKLTPGRQVTSLYFGGGTPSLIPAEQIGRLRQRAEQLWTVSRHLEVTLEVNPEDVTKDRLKAWRDLGVNRISLGVQALNNAALGFLGRAHTEKEALQAIDLTLGVFDNVSIDMIYARPGQSISDWLSELAEALSSGAPHLSLYELTIKEKTAFAKQVEREKFAPLDDDAQADLYLETLKATAKAGLPAYEVSNHARSETYWSQHNLVYWQGGDWLGVGPGAEGRLTLNDERVMTSSQRRPAEYIEKITQGGDGFAEKLILTREEDADERLIMGLRAVTGADIPELERLYGRELPAAKMDRFQESGHLHLENGRLKLTEEGWLLADYIAAELSPAD